MLQEINHVFEGKFRGFDVEQRVNRGEKYNVDIMVIDEGMKTHRITTKRTAADELRDVLKPGQPIKVEALLKSFQSGIGVSFLEIIK